MMYTMSKKEREELWKTMITALEKMSLDKSQKLNKETDKQQEQEDI